MAPPRLPPEMIHDVAEEILIRVPPDEPADLVRASLVCKLWLRIASYPAFLRRYRAFHRGAPLIGFFYNNAKEKEPAPRFVSTTAASPLPPAYDDPCDEWVHDCRHGRVLLENNSRNFVVWDPITGNREELPATYMLRICYTAMVLCAVAGCDHRDCRGGPFHVFYVCIDQTANHSTRARVYSSEARAWSTTVTSHIDRVFYLSMVRAALIGDGIYCVIEPGVVILKYDLVKHCFSFIETPTFFRKRPVLMQNEDGSLGLASVRDSRLHLWSRMVNQEGIAEWVQWRVIELEKILPVDKPLIKAKVIGFAEGVDVLFMSTDVGVFMYELKSRRVRKISGPRKYYSVLPLHIVIARGNINRYYMSTIKLCLLQLVLSC
ncbi:unnamed protein product [Urochloa decumbens]|uniref:F-box domain-containing protein n=1 Tax=Urochloa decumbens TaxID=240449 RepID=A0ABC9GBI6_9POAL